MLLCSHVYVHDAHGIDMFSTCIHGKKTTCSVHVFTALACSEYVIHYGKSGQKRQNGVVCRHTKHPHKTHVFLNAPHYVWLCVCLNTLFYAGRTIICACTPLCERSLHHWQPHTAQVNSVYTYKLQANGNWNVSMFERPPLCYYVRTYMCAVPTVWTCSAHVYTAKNMFRTRVYGIGMLRICHTLWTIWPKKTKRRDL